MGQWKYFESKKKFEKQCIKMKIKVIWNRNWDDKYQYYSLFKKKTKLCIRIQYKAYLYLQTNINKDKIKKDKSRKQMQAITNYDTKVIW